MALNKQSRFRLLVTKKFLTARVAMHRNGLPREAEGAASLAVSKAERDARGGGGPQCPA